MHFRIHEIVVPVPWWVDLISVAVVVGAIGWAIWYDRRPKRQ
jgi:hypothetical protein